MLGNNRHANAYLVEFQKVIFGRNIFFLLFHKQYGTACYTLYILSFLLPFLWIKQLSRECGYSSTYQFEL